MRGALKPGSEAGSVILAAVVLLAVVLTIVAATVPLLAASESQIFRGRQRAAAQALVDGLAGAEAGVVRTTWPDSEAGAYTTTCTKLVAPSGKCPSTTTTNALLESAVPSSYWAGATWQITVYDNLAPYASEWNSSGQSAGLPHWDSNADDRVWVVTQATVGGTVRSRAALTTAAGVSVPAGWDSEFFFSSSGKSLMITAGPDGNLWFTEPSDNKIGKITPSGTITHYTVPTASSTPQGITAGPDGNIWFTESSTNKIGRITPAGVFTEFPLSAEAHQPIGITAGPDGKLWFAEYNASKIGKISTSGVITEYPIPSTGGGVWYITAGPDGNLWFTEWALGKIGKMTTSGVATEYTVPSAGNAYPLYITKGPDGNLWFTQWGPANKIGKITPSGTITQYTITPEPPTEVYAYGITAGPDGNLWFTEQGTDMIDRITTTGTITRYWASASNGPTGITAGPDGNLWYAEYYIGQIGRMSPGE